MHDLRCLTARAEAKGRKKFFANFIARAGPELNPNGANGLEGGLLLCAQVCARCLADEYRGDPAGVPGDYLSVGHSVGLGVVADQGEAKLWVKIDQAVD